MSEKQKPAMLYREMRLEVIPPDPAKVREDGEKEDDRIPVAISSESPVERYDWFTGERYQEVLDHTKGKVDLSYARDGLPFLLDHNTRVQIGLIEDVRVDDDRKIRGMLRQGNHPDAEWAFKDIRAGVRKKVSVGYDPGEEYEQKEGAKGEKIRTYRNWLPMEGSSVAVPADYEVGIGRSAAPGAQPSKDPTPAAATPANKERSMADEAEAAAAAQAATVSASEQREKDVKKLVGYTKDFPEEARELLPSWLERGVAPDQALMEIEAKKREKAKAAPATPGFLDLTEKDRKRYNIAAAISEIAEAQLGRRPVQKAEESGLVFEADEAIRAGLAKTGNVRKPGAGILMPLDMRIDLASASRGAQIAMMFQRASVTGNIVGTSSLGGAGVQTSLVGFIDLLRARTKCFQMGVRFLPGLTDTIGFVRQLTANTFSWTGENPSTELSLTAATLEVYTMSPKIGMAGSAYSRRMLAQSSFDVNSFVLNDLNIITSIGIDTAVHSGLGSSNQPTGIRATSGVQSKTLGTHGAALAWADLVDIERLVAVANADIGTIGFLTNPNVRSKLKQTQKNTSAGAPYLWESVANMGLQPIDNLNGYQAQITTGIPSNLTKGTNTTVCSALIYGVWDQAKVGEWGGCAEIIVNPFTYAKQNVIEITSTMGIDVGVDQPTAFLKVEDILTT